MQAWGGAEFTVKFYDFLADNLTDLNGKTPKYIWTVTTDADGYARIPDNELPYIINEYGNKEHGLPIGTLTFQETKAPIGYLISNEVILRQITDNENTSGGVTVYNYPIIPEQVILGGFSMQKADKDRFETEPTTDNGLTQGSAVLSSATFEVVNKSGQSVRVNGVDYANNTVCYTFTTGTDGKFTSANNLLPYGDYLLREKTASTGYLVNATWSATFSIRTNGTIVAANSLTNNPVPEQIIRGGIKIQKNDKDTGTNQPSGAATLEGARIEIINKSAQAVYTEMDGTWAWREPNTVCYVLVTDAQGVAQSPLDALPYGSYRAVETEAPLYGYLVNADWYRDFNITQNGVIHDLTNTPVLDQVIRGDFQAVKFKGDDTTDIKTPLKDVEFTLTHKTTAEKVVITTDENGYARTQNLALAYGIWLCEETKTPVGQLTIQPFEFEVNEHGRVYYYIIENDTIRTAIRIVKRDKETGNIIPIAGTEFELKNVATGQLVEFTDYYPNLTTFTTLKTGPDGTCLLPQMLEVGEYELIELKAPYNFLGSDAPIRFTVTADTGTDFTKPLEIDVYNEPVKGRILINKIAETYLGHKVEQNELVGDVYVPQFDNYRQLAGTKWNIIAAEDIQLADGTVKHTKGEIVQTITTTEQDDYSQDLYLGKYYVQEESTVEHYIKDTTKYEVNLQYIDQDTPIVEAVVTSENKWLPSKVTVNKEKEKIVQTEISTDNRENSNDEETGVKTEITVTAGEGFSFALYTAEPIFDIPANAAVAVGTTGKDGKLIFEAILPHGQYYLQEIHTNPAYEPNDTKYPVDLSYKEDSLRIEVEHIVLNNLIHTPVQIAKFDLAGTQGLSDCHVEIKNADTDEVVYTGKTLEDGYTEKIHLAPANYLWTEQAAPDGFSISDQTYEFSINELGEVIGSTKFSDDITRIIILKKDADTKEPLSGVKFGLFDMDYNLLQEAVSDENGLVVFEGMKRGEYQIMELETLPTHKLSDRIIKVVVTEKWVNDPTPIDFENSRYVVGSITGDYLNGNENGGYTIVKTGDDNTLAFLIGLTGISGIMFSVLLYSRKKEKIAGGDNNETTNE